MGTAYVALFNHALARRHGGRFVLRIEDTDRARFREDSEQQVFDMLTWLGLTWDEGHAFVVGGGEHLTDGVVIEDTP